MTNIIFYTMYSTYNFAHNIILPIKSISSSLRWRILRLVTYPRQTFCIFTAAAIPVAASGSFGSDLIVDLSFISRISFINWNRTRPCLARSWAWKILCVQVFSKLSFKNELFIRQLTCSNRIASNSVIFLGSGFSSSSPRLLSVSSINFRLVSISFSLSLLKYLGTLSSDSSGVSRRLEKSDPLSV